MNKSYKFGLIFAPINKDFVAFAQRIGLGEAGEQAARTAFEQVDTNGNGKIDLKEAYNAYEKITQLLNMSKNQ